MTDLADGESTEMKGSGTKPYLRLSTAYQSRTADEIALV
jgi:hypothetical protein